MNYKQKLGYTLLGAGILALGIIIGQVVTPDIEARNNGVFDKIQCREIEVVDKDGKTAIRLHTTKHGGDIRMDSKDGRIANMGIGETGGVFYLSGKGRGVDPSVSMFTGEDYASIDVEGRGFPKRGISMFVTESYERIDVNGKEGSAMMAIESHGGAVWVSGKGGSAEMGTDEHGGRVDVFNRNKQFNHQAVISDNNRLFNHRATMSVNAFGNGAVSTWDKNGYRQ